jgi:hypothetical protein
LTKFFTSIPVTEASTGFLITSVNGCRTRQRKKHGSVVSTHLEAW